MNTNRREFLQGLATVGLIGAGGCLTTSAKRPLLAVQLYSIHKILWTQPEKCFADLKAGGYDGVEFAGYGKRSAKELRKMLADAGLKAAGSHLSDIADFTGDGASATLAFCAEAGIESISNPHAKFSTADDYRRFGETMGAFAERAWRECGIRTGIHTTYHHFTQKFDGVTAWDMIYKNASPLLQQQVDTANTFHTGTDVVALLKKYRNRHHSIHLKENVPTVSGVFGERPTDGGPIVPWDEIFAYMATETGCEWYIVEAEGKPDSLDPCLANARFLQRRLAD